VYRYLLDANVIVVSQKATRLEALIAAAAAVPMAIVDDVYDELTIPKPGKPETPEMREAARVLRSGALAVETILAGSSEDAARTSLRARGNPGAGEAASVAFARARGDHIVVTADRKAVAGAARLYAELPGEVGRILGLHAFLRTLVERSAIDAQVAAAISTAAMLESNLSPPLWWLGWLSTR